MTLKVTLDGSGTGTVTSGPPGIDCGSTCSTQFDEGTEVKLTAAADFGSVFTGWTGACVGTGPCTVTLAADTSVTATFDAGSPDNHAPYAVDDLGSARGAATTIPVLTNDTDVDGDDLTVIAGTQPDFGSVDCAGSGCTYAPPTDYTGTYPRRTSFSYTVGDGRGGTATATVRVTVRGNKRPIAFPDAATTHAAKEVSVPVTLNDLDPEGDDLTASLTVTALHGTATCDGANCSYTPVPASPARTPSSTRFPTITVARATPRR